VPALRPGASVGVPKRRLDALPDQRATELGQPASTSPSIPTAEHSWPGVQ
jgi:hypothetical protein